MRLLSKFGCCKGSFRDFDDSGVIGDIGASGDLSCSEAVRNETFAYPCNGTDGDKSSHLLKTMGWISAALGAVALGLIVGREIRLRYKFNRRTPYDLYAHAGDEMPDADFSVGI